MKKTQSIIVGGLLIDNKKVLILQRHKDEKIYPGMWELPSGKKELEESITKALKREFLEETGLNVKILANISVFDYVIEKREEKRYSTQINFLVKKIYKNQKIKLGSDHQDFVWATKRKLDKYRLSKKTKATIKLAFMIKRKLKI